MSIRVGESWQARNGHRRWVSMPLHDLLAFGAAWAVFWLPLWLLWRLVLAELWLAAEFLLLLFTAVLAAVVLIWGDAKPGDVTLTGLRFGLFMVDLKAGQQ